MGLLRAWCGFIRGCCRCIEGTILVLMGHPRVKYQLGARCWITRGSHGFMEATMLVHAAAKVLCGMTCWFIRGCHGFIESAIRAHVGGRHGFIEGPKLALAESHVDAMGLLRARCWLMRGCGFIQGAMLVPERLLRVCACALKIGRGPVSHTSRIMNAVPCGHDGLWSGRLDRIRAAPRPKACNKPRVKLLYETCAA